MVRKAAAQVSSSYFVSDASCLVSARFVDHSHQNSNFDGLSGVPFLQSWLSGIPQQNGISEAPPVQLAQKTTSTTGSGKRRNVIFHVSCTVFKIRKKERQLVIAPLIRIPNGAFRVLN